jgi:ketopantoate reductase
LENSHSFKQDISKGRISEIDHVNGQIISLGEKINVRTPFNKKIYDLIKNAEEMKKCPNMSPEQASKSFLFSKFSN